MKTHTRGVATPQSSKLSQTMFSILSTVVFIVLFSSLLFEASKKDVTLLENGEHIKIRTHANTVGDVLTNQQVDFQQADLVEPSEETLIKEGMVIEYEKAKKITVEIDGEQKEYYSTADTIEQMINRKRINVDRKDAVTPNIKTSLQDEMVIKVKKAFQVTLNDGGKIKSIWTTAETVQDLLEEEGIILGEYDELNPNTTTNLVVNSIVNVKRVQKITDIVEESIDYKTVKRSDRTLPSGQESVVQKGKKGRIVKHYEVTLENGKEVDRLLIKEEIKKKSQKQIIAIGTKPIQPSFQTLSYTGDKDVVRELTVKATAYTAFCTGCSGITYTGINLRSKENRNLKVIAVDPNVIPLGSKVWVEGYGTAIAGDIGSAIKGKRIDVFIPDKNRAYIYGVKNVKVKVLAE